MISDSSLKQNKPIPSRRFRQVVYFTIAMVLLATLATSFSVNSANTISLLILDILLMCALFPLIKRDKLDLAKQIFLWSNLIVLSFVFWDNGGLLSSAVILVYPIFLMISALLVGPRTFFAVYLFVVAFIVAISVEAINSYTNYNFHQFGYWEYTP